MTYLSVAQVARRLGRSPRSVRRLITNGRLAAKRDIVTAQIYIPVESVEAFEQGLVDAKNAPVQVPSHRDDQDVDDQDDQDVDDDRRMHDTPMDELKPASKPKGAGPLDW